MTGILGGLLGSLKSSVATPAYELIATANGTGVSNAKTITFTSIPTDYEHLEIRYVAKSTLTTQRDLLITFNGSGTGNRHNLTGNGTTASSGNSTSVAILNGVAASTTSGLMSAGKIQILDYINTVKLKTFRALHGVYGTTFTVALTSGQISSSTAISSLQFIIDTNGSEGFATTSRFSLYGIKG